MVNKYKNAAKEYRLFTVSDVKTGTTKNGDAYTAFKISDKMSNNGTTYYDVYRVFSWQQGLDLHDGDKVELLDINGVEFRIDEWEGKKIPKRTIFAEVNVVPNNATSVSADKLVPIDDDVLPF